MQELKMSKIVLDFGVIYFLCPVIYVALSRTVLTSKPIALSTAILLTGLVLYLTSREQYSRSKMKYWTLVLGMALLMGMSVLLMERYL